MLKLRIENISDREDTDMSTWKEYTVADVISKVIDYRGKTPKKLGGDWSDSGYRALSAKNIKTGKIVQVDSIRYVSEDMYKAWMKEEIQREDILITTEAPFGQIFFWNSDEKIVLSQRLFAIRINEKFYPKYIYFYMTSLFFQTELDGRATGTTVVGIRQPELLKCRIFAPSYEEQRIIADILWCLEQKINSNEKINNNLSDLLQTIYQEQFGDGNLITSQGILSDIGSYSKEKVAVSELNVNTYFSTENMLPGKAGSTEATNLPDTPQTTACRKGDTLISNIRPYFKKIVYCEDTCGCSTDVLCFTPVQSQYAAYLFSTLYTDKFFAFMVAGSKGTKMPRGDKQHIMTYPIVLPTENELEEFNAIAFPVIEQINSNKVENKRLSALRDALLPKLLSGEIDISTIDF